MFPGESVTFSCLVPVSAGWEYVFYQNKRQLVNTGTTLLVQSVQARSTGSYTCRGKRGTTSVFWSDYSHVIQLEVKGNGHDINMIMENIVYGKYYYFMLIGTREISYVHAKPD